VTANPESPISAQDLHLFNEGTHYRLYERLGAQVAAAGTHFSVWAPDAQVVSVIGDWNGWDKGAEPLARRGGSGIWERWVPDVGSGARYKYHIASRYRG
jgi:1,4-alpha-glucan branching enzyme